MLMVPFFMVSSTNIDRNSLSVLWNGLPVCKILLYGSTQKGFFSVKAIKMKAPDNLLFFIW